MGSEMCIRDSIFSGSLLTHLDDWQWDAFIASCVESLSPTGTFVFTVHGRISALLARDRHPMYGNMINTAELYEEYLRKGFAFMPYSKEHPTFGLSLSSPEWIMRRLQKLPTVRIVAFDEGAWQDVVALQRNHYNIVVD